MYNESVEELAKEQRLAGGQDSSKDAEKSQKFAKEMKRKFLQSLLKYFQSLLQLK